MPYSLSPFKVEENRELLDQMIAMLKTGERIVIPVDDSEPYWRVDYRIREALKSAQAYPEKPEDETLADNVKVLQRPPEGIVIEPKGARGWPSTPSRASPIPTAAHRTWEDALMDLSKRDETEVTLSWAPKDDESDEQETFVREARRPHVGYECYLKERSGAALIFTCRKISERGSPENLKEIL